MDLEQRILAAFQAEHKEQLAGIRAVLDAADRPRSADELDDAYRLAHSLKGGARVCNLAEVEQLGHRLEAVFEGLREARLELDEPVRQVVQQALDAVEDWMAALADGGPPPDLQPAAHAIDGLLASEDPPTPRREPHAASLRRRLLDAFRGEYLDYVRGIDEFLDRVEAGDVDDPDAAAEAHRMAHNLRSAARAAELEPVERLGAWLERALAKFRDGMSRDGISPDGTSPGGAELAAPIREHLRQVQIAVNQVEQSPPGPTTATTESMTSGLTSGEDPDGVDGKADARSPTAPAVRAPESVRVGAESLDRVLQTSGRLLSEGLRQNRVGRELDELGRQVEALEREWQVVRQFAAGGLHQLAATPGFRRIARYLDYAERAIAGISRQVRRAQVGHERAAWSLESLCGRLADDVRRVRMMPAEAVLQGCRKLVRDVAQAEGKAVRCEVEGLDVQADRVVLQALKDPVMHMLRNAVVHGIEPPGVRAEQRKAAEGCVRLSVAVIGKHLTVTVEDDGRGVDVVALREAAVRRGLLGPAEATRRPPAELARLAFEAGVSTVAAATELSGRGMGLSVVYQTALRLQGRADWLPREPGAAVVVTVPLAVSMHRLLLVAASGQTLALPVRDVRRLLRVEPSLVETIEGHPFVRFEGRPVPLVSLAHVLGTGAPEIGVYGGGVPAVVCRCGASLAALAVEGFVAEREALIQELSGPARLVRTFCGGVVVEGGVVLVIDPRHLLDRQLPRVAAPVRAATPTAADPEPATVLIVDDSFTTRTLEKSILEAHGYRVRVAVDGVDALDQLRAEPADLVISDIQMPHMDGFRLLEEIKRDARLAKTPVILVTSLDRRQDQEHGLELGADAYILKRKFDHEDLLDTIRQLL